MFIPWPITGDPYETGMMSGNQLELLWKYGSKVHSGTSLDKSEKVCPFLKVQLGSQLYLVESHDWKNASVGWSKMENICVIYMLNLMSTLSRTPKNAMQTFLQLNETASKVLRSLLSVIRFVFVKLGTKTTLKVRVSHSQGWNRSADRGDNETQPDIQ